ncbi:IS110 family transposase [Streptomyces sp. NPDC059076]|uniref:IS110 family transposase n=1 Tax=unclassified Streptomyces TaxID=2593676 RepID=UPI0036B691D8
MPTMYAGADWADGWVDIALVRRDGERLGHRRITYTECLDPVEEYVDFLREHNRTRWHTIPTAIEDPNLLFAQALDDRGLTVVHVSATRAARARRGSTVGGDAKSDKEDAYLLADLLRTKAVPAQPVVRSTPAARAIRVLAQAQRSAGGVRTRTLHHLRACLISYYPAAVRAWPKLGLRHPQARAILAAAPSPRAAAALTRAQFAETLAGAGRWRTVDDEAERLCLHFRRPALRLHPTVEAARTVEMLGLLEDVNRACHRAETLARQAAEAFARHPHYRTITSFPGIGDLIGSQLLGELGDNPHRFRDARALCAYAGLTPVTWASGTSVRVSMRRSANTALRVAFYQGAFSSLRHSTGANTYYRDRRKRGATHRTALRNLGARYARALHHCLRHDQLYDEQTAFPHTPTTAGIP